MSKEPGALQGILGRKCVKMGNVGSKAQDKRHHERTDARVTARFLHDGRWVVGQIKDISAGGAKIDADQPVERHTAITLSIGQFGDYEGEIVWSSGGTIGVKFSEDPQVMSEVVVAVALYGTE